MSKIVAGLGVFISLSSKTGGKIVSFSSLPRRGLSSIRGPAVSAPWRKNGMILQKRPLFHCELGERNTNRSNLEIKSIVSSIRSLATQNAAAPKKRIKRKVDFGEDDTFPVVAFATCDELNLEDLHKGLIAQGLYIPSILSDDMEDVIHTTAKYRVSAESREIFFFREGAVVFWNMPELERLNVLKFIKDYEEESYEEEDVLKEYEYMAYTNQEEGTTRLFKGKIVINAESQNKTLEKYAFANAMALSVKLGIWESNLEKFVHSIEHITEDLKRAEHVQLSRAEVLQKTGELFALRHQLNLNSDLLDTPDFYWERERLESVYQKTANYLSITRRTNVMNEKLTQCCELLDLISTHLTDQHHTRLEWMIIALITIEVGFEILHVIERYGII